MKTIYLTVFTLCVLISNQAIAQICKPGDIKSAVAVQKIMQNLVSNPEFVQISNEGGSLTLSPLPEDFFNISTTSYEVRIKVLRTYRNRINDFGAVLNWISYKLKPIKECTDYEVTEVISDNSLTPPPADMALSLAAHVALTDLTANSSFVPLNRHSGSHSLKVFVPESCSDGTFSVNVLRSYHSIMGIENLVFSYLVDLHKPSILKKNSRFGRFLNNMCQERF